MKLELMINRFAIPEADSINVPIDVTTTFDATGIMELKNSLTQIETTFKKTMSAPTGFKSTMSDYFNTSALEKQKNTLANFKDSIRNTKLETPPITVGEAFSQNTPSILEVRNAYDTVLDKFKESDSILASVSERFNETFKNGAVSVSDLKGQVGDAYSRFRELNTEMENTEGSSQHAGQALKQLAKIVRGSVLIQIQALAHTLRRLFRFLEESFTAAGDYVESINLYTMSVGQYAEAGKKWATEISNALYLDTAEIYQYTGQFFNLTRGLGATAEAADLMSRNLTQLSYDMASYLNIDVSVANNKLMSAMSGQTKAVTSVGIAVQSASLQELAYSLNIQKSVQEMTQAEKTYLRYIQIMRSTTQMQGDLGRTIITPTNAMRLLKTQITLLARAIGQVFTPIIMEVIPIIIAFTQVLTELAQTLAKLFGYKLEDYLAPADSVKALANGFEDLDDAAKGAGKSIQRTLAPFDELNVVETSSKGRGAGGGADSVLSDLEQYLDGYDMLEFYTERMKDKIENMKKLIKTIGPIVAAAFAVGAIAKFLNKLLGVKDGFDKLSKTKLGSVLGSIIANFKAGKKETGTFVGGLKNVWKQTSTLTKALIGTAGLTVGMQLTYKGMQNLGKGSKDLGKNLVEFGGGIAAAAAGGAALGSIIPGIGTAVGALAGGFAGALTGLLGFASGVSKLREEMAKKELFGDLVISTESFKKMLTDMTDNVLPKANPRLEELTTILERTKESFDGNLGTVETYLKQFSVMGDKIENEDGVKFTEALNNMFQNANQIVSDANEQALLSMTEMLQGTTSLTQQEQQNLLTAVTENGEYRKQKVQEIEDSVYDIYNTAIAERGYLTQEEKRQIEELLKQIDELTLRAVTQTEAKLKIAQENFNTDSLDMAYESYENLIDAQEEYAKESESLLVEQRAKDMTLARNTAEEQLTILKDNNKDMADEIQKLWTLRLNGDEEGYKKGLEALSANNKEVASKLQEVWDLRETGEKAARTKYEEGQAAYKKTIQESTDAVVKDLSKKYKDLGTETEGLVSKERQILSKLLSKLDNEVFQDLHKQFLQESGMIGEDAGKELIKKANDYTKNNEVIIKGRAVIESVQSGEMKFRARAAGGFPDTGEMFIAREAGPEMIGRIGNRTAVANNDQIATALTNAMLVALNGANTGKQPIHNTVYIGSDKVYSGMGNYVDSQNDRYGTNYIRV